MLGVLSGEGKTTLTVYICVLGVPSGQGKTKLTVHLCIRSVSGRGKITLKIVFYIITILPNFETKMINFADIFLIILKSSGNGPSIVSTSWNPDKIVRKFQEP